MSKRNWIAATAFGLIISAFSADAQELAQPSLKGEQIAAPGQEQGGSTSDQNATPEPSYAERFLTAIERIEPAIRKLIAEEDEIDRKRQEDRDNRDLDAQESMALWAMAMFWATVSTVLLTGVGVVLIYRTLLYTKHAAMHAGEAVTEARNATSAAQDAVVVTREIGEAQARAYPSFSEVNLVYNDLTWMFDAEVVIANTGNSPMRETVLQGSINLTFKDGERTSSAQSVSVPALMPDLGGQGKQRFPVEFSRPPIGRNLASSLVYAEATITFKCKDVFDTPFSGTLVAAFEKGNVDWTEPHRGVFLASKTKQPTSDNKKKSAT